MGPMAGSGEIVWEIGLPGGLPPPRPPGPGASGANRGPQNGGAAAEGRRAPTLGGAAEGRPAPVGAGGPRPEGSGVREPLTETHSRVLI